MASQFVNSPVSFRDAGMFALIAPSHLGKLKTLGGGELVVFNKGALLVIQVPLCSAWTEC